MGSAVQIHRSWPPCPLTTLRRLQLVGLWNLKLGGFDCQKNPHEPKHDPQHAQLTTSGNDESEGVHSFMQIYIIVCGQSGHQKVSHKLLLPVRIVASVLGKLSGSRISGLKRRRNRGTRPILSCAWRRSGRVLWAQISLHKKCYLRILPLLLLLLLLLYCYCSCDCDCDCHSHCYGYGYRY